MALFFFFLLFLCLDTVHHTTSHLLTQTFEGSASAFTHPDRVF